MPSGALEPSARSPVHASVCAPAASAGAAGVATTWFPSSTWNVAEAGARANVKLAVLPVTVKPVRMSSTVMSTDAVAVRAPETALIAIAYEPFGNPGGGVKASVCAPAGFCAVRRVEKTAPVGSMSCAVTVAAELSA